jgi:hypothetical protein
MLSRATISWLQPAAGIWEEFRMSRASAHRVRAARPHVCLDHEIGWALG